MTRRVATRVRWGALVAGLVLTAAACGSTVPPEARQAAAQRGGDLSGGVDASGSGAVDSLGESTGSGATGSIGGSGRSTTGGGTRATTGSGSSGGRVLSTALGPGVTDKEIFIGSGYAVNAGAANAAIGAAGIDQGDDKRNAQIVIDDINAKGGIAGRKLVPVWYELDATSPTNYEQQYQAVCETLTKDNKVFAVGGGGESETLLRCLHNAGVIAITDDLTVSDAARMKRYPYYWELGSLNLDRIAAAQVAAVNAQGYFSGSWNTATGAPMPGKAKVGILSLDMPAFKGAIDRTLVPALAKLGYRPDAADIVYANQPQSQADVGNTAAAVSSAVLKFRSDGVTHVFILEDSAVLSLLFANNADSQGYHPRYAGNTQNGYQALLDQGAYPRGQLPGTVGIGWVPGIDVTPSENTDDGPYSNETRRKCIALYKAHGVSYSSANAAQIALGTCNSLWFFRDVMKNVSVLNRDGFRAAADGLGTSHESPSHFLVRFDADHHDGIAAVRYWAYRPECGCMRYTSGNIAVD
jgi:hypothetical protein